MFLESHPQGQGLILRTGSFDLSYAITDCKCIIIFEIITRNSSRSNMEGWLRRSNRVRTAFSILYENDFWLYTWSDGGDGVFS
jgi:hypothetical protein